LSAVAPITDKLLRRSERSDVPKAEISDSAQLTHRDQKKSIFQL
jgi:hypothetical protein